MVYPLLPALVTARLGGGAVALGALDGVSDAVAAGVKLVSGKLADRARLRGPLIVVGYAISALVRPLMGWATAAWQVIALRGVDRLGKGARNPPRDAVIADASGPLIRGRAFGFHRSMDHAGAVVGPLIAWILLGFGTMTPARVIVMSVIPGVLAVAIVAWAVRRIEYERAPDETPPNHGDDPDSGDQAVDRAAPGEPRLLLLIILFAFARFPETLLLLRLQGVGVAVTLIPLVWAGLHVLRALGGYPGGWLSDRVGARWTMLLGWCSYVAVCLGLALVTSPVASTIVFLCIALVTSLTEAPERAFVAAATGSGGGKRETGSGTRFGVYHAAVGVAALGGGLAFGALYDRMGAGAALLMSGAVALLAVLLGLALGSSRGPAEKALPDG